MDDLKSLAEHCERATGPDRELDALIRCAVFASKGAYVKQSPINGAWCIYEVGYNGKERSWEPRGLSPEARNGSFTASLDAAMTLVSEGSSWSVHDPANADGSKSVFGHASRCYATVAGSPNQYDYAATPALALCAAALRSLSGGEG